jgi:hypothetical protein
VEADYDVSVEGLVTPAEKADWRDSLVTFEDQAAPVWQYVRDKSGTRVPTSVTIPRLGTLRTGDFIICTMENEDSSSASATTRQRSRKGVGSTTSPTAVDDDPKNPVLLQITSLHPEQENAELHVLRYFHPIETVIGSSRLVNEVFASTICSTISLAHVARRVVVKRTVDKVNSDVYVCRKRYDPATCRFVHVSDEKPSDCPPECSSCQTTERVVSCDQNTLILRGGQKVEINDVVFLEPGTFVGTQALNQSSSFSSTVEDSERQKKLLKTFSDSKKYPEFWRQSSEFQGIRE